MGKFTGSYNKMLKYVITCQECEWSFVTDSTADVSTVGKKHRNEHDRREAFLIRKRAEQQAERIRLQNELSQEERMLEMLERSPSLIQSTKDNIESLRTQLADLESAWLGTQSVWDRS